MKQKKKKKMTSCEVKMKQFAVVSRSQNLQTPTCVAATDNAGKYFTKKLQM